MTAACPAGHTSAADDFCAVCGMPIEQPDRVMPGTPPISPPPTDAPTQAAAGTSAAPAEAPPAAAPSG